MTFRRALPAALAVWLGVAAAAAFSAQPPPTPAPYTMLSRDGQRALPARTIGGQEVFALDDLAAVFELSVKEDALAGGLTVGTRGQSIALSSAQGLASIGGRVISLPSPPIREGGRWYVPVDFVSRALALALGTRIELRKPSRLVVVGDVRVPRIAGTIEPLGGLARLTLDIAPATPHSVSQAGSRLTVRFEADALDPSIPATTAPDLIQAVRPGETPNTLAIDLGPRFGSFRASDLPGDRGTGRLVIEVLSAAADAAPEPPADAPAPEEVPPLLDLVPPGAIRTIVIDPGHGGTDDGARGADGTLEKNVTLAVARRVKAGLEARLGARVILTRDGDQTVGLDERAAVANNNKADLFISLHVNASVRPSVQGAEVFYLSLDEYGDEAQRVARASSESLPVLGGGARDIELTLWEMAQARHIQESASLATTIEAALRERIAMSPRALQQAPFRVLVGANMPAVLVEMGFVTNPEQERQLASEAFQASVAQALVDSVVRYRDRRATAAGAAQ